MKIAIKGHISRGKEVARILESLGGKNIANHSFRYRDLWYHLDSDNFIICSALIPSEYKKFSLEEFEKEFPFKIGNVVLLKGLDKPYEIVALELYMNRLCYKLDNGLHYDPNTLTTYKEMKKERNITLTLEKAKEWYKKGGELKEVALQAFTEKELNSLPKSWEEFCENYPVRKGESWIGGQGIINICAACYDGVDRRYKNWIPSKKSAEAYIAMIQLEQLRDCYNNSCNDISRIAIINNNGNIELYVDPPFNCFLTFKNHLLAREFFSNFKEIIEIAKELI